MLEIQTQLKHGVDVSSSLKKGTFRYINATTKTKSRQQLMIPNVHAC